LHSSYIILTFLSGKPYVIYPHARVAEREHYVLSEHTLSLSEVTEALERACSTLPQRGLEPLRKREHYVLSERKREK